MDAIFNSSFLLYCIFLNFVYYQQIHAKGFRGSTQVFGLFISTFALVGLVTEGIFLLYYGYKVVWWSPIAIFILGLLSTVIGALVEKVVGILNLSLIGLIVWPISAYYMFKCVPLSYKKMRIIGDRYASNMPEVAIMLEYMILVIFVVAMFIVIEDRITYISKKAFGSVVDKDESYIENHSVGSV